MFPLIFLSSIAAADTPKQPAPTPSPSIGAPKPGDKLDLAGAPDWPKLSWMYEAPATSDAAGKVVLHWFCSPKVGTCVDDLARVVALRDTNRVYIVAYINGSQRDAKKLDPIRESEGVGRGTVAYGPGVTKLMKDLGIAAEGSIVVDVDGKVKAVTSSGDINELDARDKVVSSSIDAIKEYSTSQEGPTSAVKPNDKFALTFRVHLASWLAYTKKTPSEFTLSAPKDVKCDASSLKSDQLKIEGRTMSATVTCTAPKGIYEVRGQIRFGYDSPGGGTGTGLDGATWKFEVK
jgi:hypothetical protein